MTPPPAIDYETIFLQAPVGMCISENRVIQACNEAMATTFGYTREALRGASFHALYPTQVEFLRTGHGIWTFEDVSENRPGTAELTTCEREIAALLVDGKTSKIIAHVIELSPLTVE